MGISRWFERKKQGEVVRLEPTAVERAVLDAEARLPGHVVVLSADGLNWAKEWGAQIVEFTPGPDFEIVNTYEVKFGPMGEFWRHPYYMTILTPEGTPLTTWVQFWDEWQRRLMLGDHLVFGPGQIRFTMDYSTSGMRKSRPYQESHHTPLSQRPRLAQRLFGELES